MEPLINPFSPGAGNPPPELAGRNALLERSRIVLGRVQNGKSEKSLLFVGLRGVGKTVLLNEIKKQAENFGCKTIFFEAHNKKSLPELMVPHLRQILYQLDRSRKVVRALRVFTGFLKTLRLDIKFNPSESEMSLGFDPELGSADSGDLESDLPILFEAVAEAAKDRGTSIAIFIDELQYLSEKELSSLIMAVHRTCQRQLPLILIGAGLPQLVALAGDSKSYSERLFDFPTIGALEKKDSFDALQNPVRKEKVRFSQEALDEIFRKTCGYPYFIQEWGYQVWNQAQKSPIGLEVVIHAEKSVIQKLDDNFFRVRCDRLTPSERRYVQALAELGSGSQRSGDIAEKLKVKPQSVSPVRSKLIAKGMIYAPTHGDTEFTVPLFDEFVKRTMLKGKLK